MKTFVLFYNCVIPAETVVDGSPTFVVGGEASNLGVPILEIHARNAESAIRKIGGKLERKWARGYGLTPIYFLSDNGRSQNVEETHFSLQERDKNLSEKTPFRIKA